MWIFSGTNNAKHFAKERGHLSSTEQNWMFGSPEKLQTAPIFV
jgi:hypothetical protein